MYSILDPLIKLIFSPACPVCRDLRPASGHLLCRDCGKSIHYSTAQLISRTGSIYPVVSCSEYRGPVRRCIKAIKFGERPDLIREFLPAIRLLSPGILGILSRNTTLVPVPAHSRRIAKRGFNQSESIAFMLKDYLHVPVERKALAKTKDTLPQACLDGHLRRTNLKDAFTVTQPSSVQGRDIVLVDDVVTTGSTLEACAVALLSRGATKCLAFTLARSAFFVDEIYSKEGKDRYCKPGRNRRR